MKRYILIAIALLILSPVTIVKAQISHGGKPLSFTKTKSGAAFSFEEMPAFDLAAELQTDALNEAGDLRGGYRFAYKFMTDFHRGNSGTSFTLADGTRVWRLGIRSAGALSINVLFTEYELPDGAQVFLYNPSQTHVLGAFTSANNSSLEVLPVSPVYGDELIVEYLEPADAPFPGRLKIGEVNHGYRSLRGYEPGSDRSQYHCMPPPVCYLAEVDTIDRMARSTVLITVDGVTACSGVMVNNTLSDGKPYLLTASHCLNKNFLVENPDYADVAGRIVCFFHYTSPTCETVRRGAEELSMASATYKAVNVKHDMALLELLEMPPAYYRPYYAGWDLSDEGNQAPYTAVHHPRASVKRVNITESDLSLTTFDISQMQFEKDAHWQVKRWDVGSTDGGSSGSPLFNKAGLLVGALSGGQSTCDDPANDFYYTLSNAWTASDVEEEQLKHWLNPTSKAETKVDGLDPYAPKPCYRLSHIYDLFLQDSVEVTPLPEPAKGNLFGLNDVSGEYVEKYTVTGSATLFGTYLVTPSIPDAIKAPDVDIVIYSGDTKPQTLLHTEKFSPTYTELQLTDSTFVDTPKRLNRDQESFILFTKPIQVSGTFYVGYRIQASEEDAFAVYNLPKGQSKQNTTWCHLKADWVQASDHPLMPLTTSLFVDPVLQYSNGHSAEAVVRHPDMQIYLDPEKKSIHVVLSAEEKGMSYSLYSISGALVKKGGFSGSQVHIPVSELSSGAYIVTIRKNNISYAQKIIF